MQPLWSALDDTVAPLLAHGALLCVSGGPDSRTLLECCAHWAGRTQGRLEVACVDHALRAEAASEASAVVARAHALGFSAVALRVRPDGADEGSLRQARYQALARHARANALASLVVAHHRGDVAEGRLLSLVGEGGGALRARSEVFGVRVLRPFLSLGRADLALARAALGVRGVFQDPERRSARARLRHQLPSFARPTLLEERAALDALRRAQDEDALAPLAFALLDDTHRSGVSVRAGPAALVRRALMLALAMLAPTRDLRASSPAIDDAVDLLLCGRPGEVHLAGSVVARADPRARVLWLRALADGPVPAYAPWDRIKGAEEGTEES